MRCRFLALALLGTVSSGGGCADLPEGKPTREFRAHCDSAVQPNFLIPMQKIANHDKLAYSEAYPDGSGANSASILTGSGLKVVTRFGTPKPNDVWVAEYAAAAPGKTLADDTFGRVVRLFRFCH